MNEAASSTRTITVEIIGMHCASCGILVDDCLEDVDGVVTSQTSSRTGQCVAVVAAGFTGTIAWRHQARTAHQGARAGRGSVRSRWSP